MVARAIRPAAVSAVAFVCLNVCMSDAAAQSFVGLDQVTGAVAEREQRSAGGPKLALSLNWQSRATRTELAGGLSLTLPTDALFARPRASPKAKQPEAESGKRPAGKVPTRAASAAAAIDDQEAREERVDLRAEAARSPDRTLAAVIHLGGQDALAALDAAARQARITQIDERIDGMAERSRWAAAFPELRLRATRLVSESASAMPTSYDPFRQTSTDGVSLWLEARATWSLDRAVFSEHEIRLERVSRKLASEHERLSRRVLDLLFAWQSAVFAQHDRSAPVRECREAYLRQEQLATELDVMTGGWFSRWRRERDALPASDCLASSP